MLDRIERKIRMIEDYLGILDGLGRDCLERFSDPIHRGATLHYLYLTADGCVALAEMALKERGRMVPQSYAATIDELGTAGIVPATFAYDFSKIASFRNFLAHDYEQVDPRRICGDAIRSLPEVRIYLGYLKAAFGL